MHADHGNQSDRGLCCGDRSCRRRPVARQQRSEVVATAHAREPREDIAHVGQRVFAVITCSILADECLNSLRRQHSSAAPISFRSVLESLPFVMFPSRHFTRLCSFRIGGPHPVAYRKISGSGAVSVRSICPLTHSTAAPKSIPGGAPRADFSTTTRRFEPARRSAPCEVGS